MHWSSLGLGANVWEIRVREAEHFVRGFFHIRRADPEDELPDAELPENERVAALRREAARRLLTERG